jgi:phosphatidate phosphatase APP1
MHLKRFRLKDASLAALFEDPVRYKLAIIEPLLQAFPRRSFVLVGDSGEKDPEVYGIVARRYPIQVQQIYIRDMTGEPADHSRYQAAFRGFPAARWRLFRDPSQLGGIAVDRPAG